MPAVWLLCPTCRRSLHLWTDLFQLGCDTNTNEPEGDGVVGGGGQSSRRNSQPKGNLNGRRHKTGGNNPAVTGAICIE